MQVADVVDRETLEAYLRGLPNKKQQEASLSVAFFAAARVLPIAVNEFLRSGSASNRRVLPLAIFGAVSAIDVVRHNAIFEVGPVARYTSRIAQAFAGSAGPNSGKATQTIYAAAYAAAYAADATRPIEDVAVSQYIGSTTQAALDSVKHGSEIFKPLISVNFWELVRNDLNVEHSLIWPHGITSEVRKHWDYSIEAMMESDADWQIWKLWYERILTKQNRYIPALRSAITRIAQDDWILGPAAINPKFNDLLALYLDDGELKGPKQDLILTKGKVEDVKRTRSAMIQYRRELPPSFENVQSFISLEVERLQSRNYRNEIDQAECERQIAVLFTIHEALDQLLVLIPERDDMAECNAEEAESLVRLYFEKFKIWPRANADEIVDNTYRAALIAASAFMAPMLGVPAGYALAAGAAVFGGKKLAEGAKAAIELSKDSER